jgi:SAM-dependent methyltransferase
MVEGNSAMSSRKQDSKMEPLRIDVEQLYRISEVTLAHYDQFAEAYWDGTRDHDVSQNYTELLDAIEGDSPYSILDLGCGPGRDLHHFRALGHEAVGLDGSKEFVAMARAYSGCEVLHQDFLAMELPKDRFDGVFANASLFGKRRRGATGGQAGFLSARNVGKRVGNSRRSRVRSRRGPGFE